MLAAQIRAAYLQGAMIAEIATHRAAVAALCARFHVRRLDVFGSAARGTDFDPARSDIDLLVEYEPEYGPAVGDFLALQEALEALFGRKVDLTMASAIRNPYLRANIEAERAALHGG